MIPYTDAIFSKKEVLKILKQLAEEEKIPKKVARPPTKRKEASNVDSKVGIKNMDNKGNRYTLHYDVDN